MPNIPTITPPPRAVWILGFPDAQLLDIAGPLQVFASANASAKQAGEPLPYRISVVAQRSPVVTNSGLAVHAEPLPAPEIPVDTLVVAGG